MRVLMVTEIYPPNCSGGGWSTYNLAKALNETEEVDVKVLAVNQEEVKEDVPVEKIKVTRFPNELAYYQIKKEIDKRKEDFDIIQGQHSLTIPPLGLIDDKPTVGVIRDYWPICYRTTLRDRFGNNHLKCGWKCLASTVMDWHVLSPYKLINHYNRSKMARKLDEKVSISHFVDQRLEENNFGDTTIIPDLVQDKKNDDIDKKGKGDIVYFGKMMPHKGPQDFIEAIPEVLDKHPDQDFVLMGLETEFIEELENKIEELDLEEKVELLGYVSTQELNERIEGAKAVVHPARWHEPLSMSRIEALSMGKVIISSRTGSADEMINDGENGYLFDNVEELSEKMIQIQDNGLRKKMEEKARKTYEKKYSEEKVLENWINLYSGFN